MATKVDVYKSAVDFAFDTLSVKSSKDLMEQSLARFNTLLYGDGEWEFWISNVNQQRERMTGLSTQKVAPMKLAPVAPSV